MAELIARREGWHIRDVWKLTPSEIAILKLIAIGLQNKEIARALGISFACCRTHISEIFSKICVRDRLNAARWAWRNGILSVDEAWAAIRPNDANKERSSMDKLPPCPICEEYELRLRRSGETWGVHCLNCGWDSGEQVCRDGTLLKGLVIQHIAVIAAGYNIVAPAASRLAKRSGGDVANRLIAASEGQMQAPPPMTNRQRNFLFIAQSLARDMKINGTTAEKWTAALLELCADQVAAGNVAELTEAMRVWCREREGEIDPLRQERREAEARRREDARSLEDAPLTDGEG